MQGVKTNYLRTLFLEHRIGKVASSSDAHFSEELYNEKIDSLSDNVTLYYMFISSAAFKFNVVVLPCSANPVSSRHHTNSGCRCRRGT